MSLIMKYWKNEKKTNTESKQCIIIKMKFQIVMLNRDVLL